MWPQLIYGEHMLNWLRLGFVVGAIAPMVGGCSADTGPSSGNYLPGDGDQNPGDGDQNQGDGDETPGDGDQNPGDGDQNPGDGDGSECGLIEKEAAIARGPVDMVWAIDSSLSMLDKFINVTNNLAAFADSLQKSGANAKVVMIHGFGTDPVLTSAFGMDPNRYKYLTVGVDSHNALSVYSDQFNNYKSFLRSDAPTHFVVVTDDESSPMTAAAFQTGMEGKLGHDFTFHAIVEDGTCNSFLGGKGTQYMTLADATGGGKHRVCTADWSGLFKELESAVLESAPLPCDFEVPAPPAGEALDKDAVLVNFEPTGQSKTEFPKANDAGQCGDKLGWFFSGDRMELCPNACTLVKKGGAISIGFGCQPQILF